MDHTSLPWQVGKRKPPTILNEDSTFIMAIARDVDNADFIVKSVNNHDALIEALKNLIRSLPVGLTKGSEVDSASRNAHKVIAKAEGRE